MAEIIAGRLRYAALSCRSWRSWKISLGTKCTLNCYGFVCSFRISVISVDQWWVFDLFRSASIRVDLR
jgi:hypothetical protein